MPNFLNMSKQVLQHAKHIENHIGHMINRKGKHDFAKMEKLLDNSLSHISKSFYALQNNHPDSPQRRQALNALKIQSDQLTTLSKQVAAQRLSALEQAHFEARFAPVPQVAPIINSTNMNMLFQRGLRSGIPFSKYVQLYAKVHNLPPKQLRDQAIDHGFELRIKNLRK